MPSERAFSVQNLIHNKLRNRIGVTKAAKLVFIYINSRALKYKWTLEEKKKQGPTWLTLSEEEEIEMENAKIEYISNIDQGSTELEVEYVAENVTMNPAGNYFEMGDDDV